MPAKHFFFPCRPPHLEPHLLPPPDIPLPSMCTHNIFHLAYNEGETAYTYMYFIQGTVVITYPTLSTL